MSETPKDMTEAEKLVYVCRRCKHCYRRHTSPRIEHLHETRHLVHRSTHVCMVHAKALSDKQHFTSVCRAVPCAIPQNGGLWYPQDFEMRDEPNEPDDAGSGFDEERYSKVCRLLEEAQAVMSEWGT